MDISPAAFAALCDYRRFVCRNIGKDPARFGFLDYGSSRHFNDKIFGFLPVASASPPVLAFRSRILSFIAEVGERT